jgi:hypothetical protein
MADYARLVVDRRPQRVARALQVQTEGGPVVLAFVECGLRAQHAHARRCPASCVLERLFGERTFAHALERGRKLEDVALLGLHTPAVRDQMLKRANGAIALIRALPELHQTLDRPRIIRRECRGARERQLGALGIAHVLVVQRAELKHDLRERGLVLGQARELYERFGRLVVLAFVPQQIRERP